MGKNIKYAGLEDLAFLEPLISEQLKETNQNHDKEKTMTFLKDVIKRPTWNIILLIDTKLLGASLCSIDCKFWNTENYGNIQWFYIMEQYCNFYNAKRLLKSSEDWLKNFNIKWIETDVWHLDKDLHCDNKYTQRFKKWSMINNYNINGHRFYKRV